MMCCRDLHPPWVIILLVRLLWRFHSPFLYLSFEWSVCAGLSLSLSLSLCVSVSVISGLVSCACCADNQWMAAAGSVQQEQEPGLLSVAFSYTHTHTHTHREREREREDCSPQHKLQVWPCKIHIYTNSLICSDKNI